MPAGGRVGSSAVRRLDVEAQERERDGAALRLTDDVDALLVVGVRVRIVRRRDVARTGHVHAAACCTAHTPV